MRYIPAILILILCRVGVAQTADDVLKKHFADYGQDLWNEILTAVIDGKIVDADYKSRKIKLTYKRPGHIRMEGLVNGKKFIQATDGTLSWQLAPWKTPYQPQYMNVEEDLILRHSFIPGSPLYPYRQSLEFLGLKDLDGELYLAFSHAEPEKNITFYLAKEDFRLYHMIIVPRFGTDPKPIHLIVDKYKDYGTQIMPTAIVVQTDSESYDLVFEQIYLGMGASDEIFKMPAQ